MTTYHPASQQHTLIPLSPIAVKRPRSSHLFNDADTNTPTTVIGQQPPSPTSMISAQQSSGVTDNDVPSPSAMASRHVRRSSSRIHRWVEDQSRLVSSRHNHAGTLSEASAATTHSYSTYPQLSRPPQLKDVDELSAVVAQVSLNDVTPRRVSDASVSQSSHEAPPSTPRKSSSFRPASNIFQAPSPLRNFQRAFGTRRSSAPSSSGTQSPIPPPSSSSPSPYDHDSSVYSAGSTASTIYRYGRSSRTQTPDLASSPPRSQASWRFRPPSAHAPFASEGASEVSQPRPSTSSSVTHSSVTTYSRTSLETPVSPRKLQFGSSPGTTPSLWSLPAHASHMNDAPDSEKVLAHTAEGRAVRIPLALKTSVGNISELGTITSVLGGPKARKKRKLIVSGIPPDDEQRLDAARKWCETFGEINQITRVANGDLHVDFRKAEVADTVCRLQARVYINGVGSVCLSWFTGKRP